MPGYSAHELHGLEMLVPLLPEGVSLGTARLVFAVGFFVVAFALTLRPGVITRVLGRITVPRSLRSSCWSWCRRDLGRWAGCRAAGPYDTGAAVQAF